MKRNLDDPAGFNDYYQLFYFLYSSSNVIDRIKLVFERKSHRKIHELLKSLFLLKRHRRIGHINVDTFLGKNGQQFNYVYSFSDNGYWNAIWFSQPNFAIQNQVNSIFQEIRIKPLLSEIEFAVDTEVDNPEEFHELVQSTLFFKRQKKTAFTFVDTFYTQTTRGTSRGMRVYVKKLDGKWVHRTELQLNRESIRNAGMEFPVREVNLDLSNHFDFRYIHYPKLERFLLKQARPDIDRMNNRRPGIGNIAVQQIRSFLSSTDFQPLMKQVEQLKRKDHDVDNYSRFFRKIEIDDKPILAERTFAC